MYGMNSNFIEKKNEVLSRSYTSDFCLAPVMRFFSDFVASPARQVGYTCDKFWDKLKAARIAYFKRPGHYNHTFLLKDGAY